MIRKEKHLFYLELKRRLFHKLSISVRSIIIYSLTLNSLKFLNKQRTSLYLNTNYYKYSSFRSTSRCVLSGRTHAISKKLNISRFFARSFINNGMVTGYKRASW